LDTPAADAELCEALHVERGYGTAPANNESDLLRDRLDNQEHMSKLVLGLRALPQPVIAPERT
jgi:hypothetical protein